MARLQQQLGSDASKQCEGLKQLRQLLDMQLEVCKKIVEEETNSSSLEPEHVRRVVDFVAALRSLRTSSLFVGIRESLPGTEGCDPLILSQILQDREYIVDIMDQLMDYADELTEKITMKLAQFVTRNSHVIRSSQSSTFSKGQCDSESTSRYPAYDCKQLPGPSGCTSWSCRTSQNVIDDGKTAFMILEDAK